MAVAGPSNALEPEDYLWPLSTLRDTLLNPGTSLPSPKFRLLLRHHIDRLRTPWRRARSNEKDGPNAFAQESFSPVPGSPIEVDEVTRKLAAQLAEYTSIAAADACLLAKSYVMFVNNGSTEGLELESFLRWYGEECSALAQILLELLYLSQLSDKDEWAQLADEIQKEVVLDPAQFMQSLFMEWAKLARQELSPKQRSGNALFWASHQLRLQSAILDVLFLLLYQTPERPRVTAEGLIRGFIASGYGTIQVNRDIWEMDYDCIKLSARIRDLSVIIVLDSFSLAAIVSVELWRSNLLASEKDTITAMHLFINENTSDMLAESTRSSQEEDNTPSIPLTPTPLVCLAWAIFLHALPPDRLPPSAGYSGPPDQEMASRALKPTSGLFPWVEEILLGPLFAASADEGANNPDRSGMDRRKVIKDLLIGLTEVGAPVRIPDRNALYRIWDLLYSTGSPSTSLNLCADYWITDHPSPSRRTLLDQSEFPHNPYRLPTLLSALSGITSEAATTAEAFGVKPIQLAAEYFSNLSTITIPADPGWYRFVGKDDHGRMSVEAARSIVLPAGVLIPVGQPGTVLRTLESKQLVTWSTQVPVWGLLLEILRVATGLRGIEERSSDSDPSAVALSVGDLEVETAGGPLLAAGMRWLSCALRPVGELASMILNLFPSESGHPAVAIIELSYNLLQQYSTTDGPSADITAAAVSSLDILISLLHVQPDVVYSALRSTNFFGIPGRKRGLACALVQHDSARGQHDITRGLLRFIGALIAIAQTGGPADEAILRAAMHHVFSDTWTTATGWRYNDSSRRYLLAAEINGLFEAALSHPVGSDGVTLTAVAHAVVDCLITSASIVTYRRITESLTQTSAVIHRLLHARQVGEAAAATGSVSSAARLLSTILRIAVKVGSSNSSLPFSIFASTVVLGGEKTSLVQALTQVVLTPTTPSECRVDILRLIRAYIETTSTGVDRPSLAGLFDDPKTSLADLASLAGPDEPLDQQASVWNLLASIATLQPGCAQACIGSTAGLSVPLEMVVKHITDGEALLDAPNVLAAALGFCHAAISSPSAYTVVPTLRANAGFWKAVYDIAVAAVNTPPTFTLSVNSAGFAARIETYAYATQARANATALLATELQLLQSDENDSRSEALELVLALWRKGDALSDLVEAAAHSSCEPELHQREGQRLQHAGLQLERLKTIKLDCERDFGMGYLYDGPTQIRETQYQPGVNLAVDMLNLNWSMLLADIALTRAFRSLTESMAIWAEGDGIAATSAMRAARTLAEIAADEGRTGDVMLAIQTERLDILAHLLDTALGSGDEPDHAQLEAVSVYVRRIIEKTPSLPPSPDLPQPTGPILGILHSLFSGLASRPMSMQIETFVEVAGSFVVQATDNALDAVARSSTAVSQLAQAVTTLSEMISLNTAVWLDRLSASNLIVRSLQLVKRAQILADNVPAYMPSILLLHLALANHPASAQKLAVSNILPAYGDNAIATEAEYGRISPSPGDYSVHSAWCGMLLVIRTLLASLPDTATFVRTDIVPFVRLTTAQVTQSLSWDGESTLSLPIIEEMQSTAVLFHAISRSVGTDVGFLSDLSAASLPLLISIRHAVNLPRRFSSYIVPATVEEQESLVKELALLDEMQEPSLVDFGKTPVLASRTADLIGIARTILLALVNLSGAWAIMAGTRDVDEGLVIVTDEEVTEAIMDPVGVFNDYANLASSLSEGTPATTDNGTALLRTCQQLAETASVLSASQILLRKALLPARNGDDGEKRDVDMTGNTGRRVSLTKTKGSERDRAEGILREVEDDWNGLQEAEGTVGDRKLRMWLREGLSKAFEDMQER